ncbi:uncharacterized protein LOC143577541 [Bidens hawaiensis]|uniref:uncharacterized protein LOC143577541 n=1 Tax=Bidens hawaiensis TaxID=980011 RepID=UPI00404A4466
MAAWSFQRWGVDIMGPFPEATGKLKCLIVAVDYFTKWVEAKPVASITAYQMKKFLWDQLEAISGWCEEMKIQQIFTPVYHLQDNGQVERINQSLLKGMKTQLETEGTSWVDELQNVLWAHRTTPKTSNGETPYSLTYGQEAVVPVETHVHSLRMRELSREDNEERLRMNLDMTEERRELAGMRREL